MGVIVGDMNGGAAELEEISTRDSVLPPAGNVDKPVSSQGEAEPDSPLAGGLTSCSGLPAITGDSELGAAAQGPHRWADEVAEMEGGFGRVSIEAWLDDARNTSTSGPASSTRGDEYPRNLNELMVIQKEGWIQVRHAFALKGWVEAEGYLVELRKLNREFLERNRGDLSPEEEE